MRESYKLTHTLKLIFSITHIKNVIARFMNSVELQQTRPKSMLEKDFSLCCSLFRALESKFNYKVIVLPKKNAAASGIFS
jgi:hypothetical protein